MISTRTKRIGSSWTLFKLARSNEYKTKVWKDKKVKKKQFDFFNGHDLVNILATV
jgi:hypothetical protein